MTAVAMNSQEYATAGSYTFNVPVHNTGFVIVTAFGAGGGGGTGQNGGAGAGGAGESVEGLHYKVTPGGTLAVVVGAGGVSNAVAIQSLLPTHDTVGGVLVGGAAENSRTGAFGAGDGGGYTYVGTIRLLSGAGGIVGNGGGHGGRGGGVAGGNNNGDTSVNVGANASITSPVQKDCGRFMSGGGGGAGSGTGPSGTKGGDGGPMTFNGIPAGGPPSGAANGSGGGGDSLFASGAIGVTGSNNGISGSGFGAGGSGGSSTSLTQKPGGTGADGYVLLTWFEVT